jgi:hypothetical protein
MRVVFIKSVFHYTASLLRAQYNPDSPVSQRKDIIKSKEKKKRKGGRPGASGRPVSQNINQAYMLMRKEMGFEGSTCVAVTLFRDKFLLFFY